MVELVVGEVKLNIAPFPLKRVMEVKIQSVNVEEKVVVFERAKNGPEEEELVTLEKEVLEEERVKVPE